MSELKIQKKLTYLGLASLASSLILGPVGILGAGAIFAGKRLRLDWNKKAGEDYKKEKAIENAEISKRTSRYQISGKSDYFGRLIAKYNLDGKFNKIADKGYRLYHGNEAVNTMRYAEHRGIEEYLRNAGFDIKYIRGDRKDLKLIRRGLEDRI